MKRLVLAMAMTAGILCYGWDVNFGVGQPAVYWWSQAKELNRCALAYEQIPGTDRQALKATWDASITDYMHVLYNPQGTLPAFQRARVAIRVTTTMPLGVRACRLRMQDTNTETFYWSQKVDFLTPGTRTLEWVVDAAKLDGVQFVMHGKDSNHQLDFPISSIGLTLDFPQDGVAGHLYIESMTLAELTAPPAVERRDYPMVALARPFIEPLTMPQRIPAGNTRLEAATNPLTGEEALKMTAPGDNGVFGVNFTLVTSPRGVLGQKLGRQHGGEMTVRVTTERALPEVKYLRLVFVEAVGASYIHRQPVTLDKAGEHAISFTLPALVRTKKPWGSRDWQETPLFVLAGVTFECDKTFTGALYLDAVDAKWSRSPLAGFDFQLKTDSVAVVVTPETALRGVPAQLCNMSSEAVTFHISGKLTDCRDEDQGWHFERDLTLAGGETLALCRVPVPQRYGVYYIDLTVSGGGHEPQTYRRSFAHFQPTGPKQEGVFVKGFKFGSVCHLDHCINSPETVQEAATAMSQIGLRILRTDVRWNDNPMYLAHLDDVVDKFLAAGMNFDFILPGHRQGKAQYALSSNLAGYRKLFERYRGRVQYWEMLNEPDIPWGPVEEAPKSAAYIELAQQTAQILREVDPQAQLMSAGWCTLVAGRSGMGPFHRDAMAAMKDVFDVHCFHGHGPFERYAKHTIQEGLLEMRNELGVTIPWYANETALTSSGGVTEKIQAEALYKKLLFSWSRGAIGYTWYNLRSKGELADDGEHNYGMMTWDFYPKAVYAAYNGLTGLYHDKEFARACGLPWGEWAFVFKGDRELAVALWNDGEVDIPRVFRTDAAAAASVDLFGNRQALPVIDGTVLVTTTNEPQTLLLSGAKSAELLPPLSRFAMPEMLMPGQPQPMTVVLTNPFGDARQATVKLTLPPTVAASQSQFTAQVASHSQAEFATTLTLTAASANSLLAKEWVMAEGQLAGLAPVRQMHLLPVPFQFVSRLDGDALFTLADHTKITQLFVGDPAKEDSTWKGAADLSAQVWLAMDDQALTVKVVVTDDQHWQRNTAEKRSWDGDGIQLFLMPSGMPAAVAMDFAREEDGRSHVFLRRLPPGVMGGKAALRLATARTGTQTTYVITVPFAAIGSTAEAFGRGFRFNLMINDADNGVREGWAQVAPGIGSGTVNTQIMPLLLAQ